MSRKYGAHIFTGIFVISMILVFCAGYFRKSITLEAGMFNLVLSSEDEISKSKTVKYDIQNQGFPKKLVQPDKISITTGHGSGVLNSSDNPIWLLIKVTGAKGTIKILSTNPIFNEKSQSCIKPLMPGDKLDVNVNFYLPDKVFDNYNVSKGKIEFWDYKSNKKIGEVPLEIINSKPNNNCCAVDSN